MPTIVLIDDARVFRDDRECRVATNPADGVLLLKALQHRRIDELWLDHDLGGDLTIWPVVHLLEDEALAGRRWDIGVVMVHAQGSGPAYRIGMSLRRVGYLTARVTDLRVFTRRTPPAEDEGWEDFHRQLYDVANASSPFIRWKMLSTGVHIARDFAAARQRGRADWTTRHGALPEAWPIAHPPLVLWLPRGAHPACVACTWIGRFSSSPDDAGDVARLHAVRHQEPTSALPEELWKPLRVWRRDAPSDEAGPEWTDENVSGTRQNEGLGGSQ